MVNFFFKKEFFQWQIGDNKFDARVANACQ
jgi:hypothetical protein